MANWLLTLMTVLFMVLAADPPPTSAPTSQAATSQPADTRSTLRRPAQAEILRNLLSRQDRPAPIRPTNPGEPEHPEGNAGVDAQGQPLLLEGTFLVERPARLIHEGGRTQFILSLDARENTPRVLPALENQLLETAEREAASGFSEFIISASVTRYHGQNYLLLHKVLRRVGNGNVSP